MLQVTYSGQGESDAERHERVEKETIRRLKEWIARRREQAELILRDERDVVIDVSDEKESTLQ